MERATHDRGGWTTDAPIDRAEHELADWELLMDAVVDALARSGVMNVDEMRRSIESMPPAEYEAASYYERWLFAAETVLVEKGILAPEELDERTARFAVGDEVRVVDRAHTGHHRTPGYLKGKRGTIARVHRTFTNPETRAYGEEGQPRLRLYLVEFAHDELWATPAGDSDRVCADIFEHWLEHAS